MERGLVTKAVQEQSPTRHCPLPKLLCFTLGVLSRLRDAGAGDKYNYNHLSLSPWPPGDQALVSKEVV
jgi:hypothetical protein